MQNDITKFVRKICIEKNISIEELADRMGIGIHSAYSCYFAGSNSLKNMRVQTILVLANALEVEPDIIFHLAVKEARRFM